MKIPAALTAGDSATWTDIAFTDAVGNAINSASYTLTYALRGPTSAANADLTAMVNGTGWTTAITPTQSAALNTGAAAATWYWQAYATKTGERVTAGEGTLYVRPNLAGISSAAFDGRSPSEKILAAIETEITARLTGGATLEYTIGNRSLKKEPMTTLVQLRSTYRMVIARERNAQAIANGLGNPQKMGVRFN